MHRSNKQISGSHLALQLPEIVSLILSHLVIPYQYDENIKYKFYQNIHPCLFVNALWHDCASRLIWRYVTFEDSKLEFEAFLKLASTLSDPAPIETTPSALAAGLAIAIPKSTSLTGLLSDKRLSNFFYKHSKTEAIPLRRATDTNEDPLFLNYSHAPLLQQQQQQQQRNARPSRVGNENSNAQYSQLTHRHDYRNAMRSLALRKIKSKTINEPLQQLAQHTHRIEKLDIYICDHLSDMSIATFITHNHQSLTHLSLAGCNRITDEAILGVAKHCPKLEHLDLRACGLISDVSIQAIATGCPNLYHLNVGRVREREKITMQSINLIAQNTNVAVLGLAGCDMTDECLILLAKCRGSQLERISVNNCYRITNKSVRAYVKYCPNLSVFEMKECHWIDDWEAVADLVQRKVLLTLCDQQNRACTEWARRRGRVMEVKAPAR